MLTGAALRVRAYDPGVTERALVQRARLGDRQAFAELVDAYYPRCLRFASHMLGTREDAEEAVQDTFVRVHRALPGYAEQDKFEPWLFRILANRCRTLRVRTRRRERVLVFGEPYDAAAPARIDDHAWREEIALALGQLPAEQREAFLLRHVEGLGYDDIAAATGAGVSALKMRVKRACDFLRVRLREVDRV